MLDLGEKTLNQIISGSIMFKQNQKHYGVMFKILVNKLFYRQLKCEFKLVDFKKKNSNVCIICCTCPNLMQIPSKCHIFSIFSGLFNDFRKFCIFHHFFTLQLPIFVQNLPPPPKKKKKNISADKKAQCFF